MRQKDSVNGTIRGRLPDGTANPIDLHVGKRLKEARISCGLSQGRLAKEMGITFQQVQKYEKGMTRIGASRLWDLAQVLGKPINYFYDGITKNDQNKSPRKINVLKDNNDDLDPKDLTLTPMDIELISYYKKIKDPQIAKSVLDLVYSLSLQPNPHRDSKPTQKDNDFSDNVVELVDE